MADHADRARLALEQLDHVLGGLFGGLGVVGLDRGHRDRGVNAGVEGDDRDALAVDLVQEVSGGGRVQRREADGGRAGIQADLSWSVCSVTLVSSCGPTKLTL